MKEKRKMKPYEELEFTDGFMFKQIMTYYPDLCKELLELILKKKIRFLKMVEYEKTIESFYDSKGIRMDVYIEDDNNTIYDIEMQASDEPDIAKRSRYYHSSMDTRQLKRRDDYSLLRKSIVVFICKHNLGKNYVRPIYTFSNRAQEEPELELGDGGYTIMVNANCKDEYIDKELKDLIAYIRSGKAEGNEESLASRIEKLVEQAKIDGTWSLDYIRTQQLEMEIGRRYAEEEREETEKQRKRAEEAEARADNEKVRADNEKARADNEKVRANNEKARADNEKVRADNEKVRADSAEAAIVSKDALITELKAQIAQLKEQ